ncbi:DUF6808 domain-containing protein [Dysgonomonas sp. 520]|uniref:DUF6808 domain-containing protein n=1 Tax=Dysgonomonas sp. 520 TaxID=2302931 RepID=UPI0013D1D351|nr:hypothetical protein [Dysgonomonas sp. 520]
MTERIIYILVIIILIVVMIFNKQTTHDTPAPIPITTITDTIYVRDSIIITEPKYITKYQTHITTDTLYTTDSVLVPVHLPIETAIYQDSTPTYKYKAIVSGYRATLEELNIYTCTPQYNTAITKYKPYKWSLSLGASYQPFNNTFHPSINIGYNIFSW